MTVQTGREGSEEVPGALEEGYAGSTSEQTLPSSRRQVIRAALRRQLRQRTRASEKNCRARTNATPRTRPRIKKQGEHPSATHSAADAALPKNKKRWKPTI